MKDREEDGFLFCFPKAIEFDILECFYNALGKLMVLWVMLCLLGLELWTLTCCIILVLITDHCDVIWQISNFYTRTCIQSKFIAKTAKIIFFPVEA